MATKNNPGPRDFYAELAPDEPYFILRGNDKDAAMFVRFWSWWRIQQVDAGMFPPGDREQAKQGQACASEMEIWYREKRHKEEVATMEFDDRGIPLTGEHARKNRNSTSGANDT